MACFITPLIAGVIVGIIKRVWKTTDKLKLSALELMLLGGSLVLAAEHAWHGEIVPYPPFLTGGLVLREVSVVGGSMTLAVTLVWITTLKLSKLLEVKFRPPIRISSIR